MENKLKEQALCLSQIEKISGIINQIESKLYPVVLPDTPVESVNKNEYRGELVEALERLYRQTTNLYDRISL